MVNWQITATTLLCTQSGQEVTVIVHKDGTMKCTAENPVNSGIDKSRPGCAASTCPQTKAYFEKLMSEEKVG